MWHHRLPIIVLTAWGMVSWAHADDAWHFRLSPYAWIAGLEGDVASIPGLPTVPIDVSPSDALDDTEVSFMIMLDAKKGRHGLFSDFLYSDVRSDEELLPAPISLTLKSKSETTIFTLAYQYQAYAQDGFILDLLAGARHWNVDTELRFSGGLGLLSGKEISHSESWIDPVIGIKGRAPFGNTPFYAEGGAGIGGFGIGADLVYEINAVVGYQWSPTIGTMIGYRMFDVDYDDGFIYDVRQDGWQVGLTWAF